MSKVLRCLAGFVFLAVQLQGPVSSAEVRVAVAANFAAPMREMAQAFAQETGHQAILSFGSTGNFYAQIRNGAPFHILLAADQETPANMVREGLGLSLIHISEPTRPY